MLNNFLEKLFNLLNILLLICYRKYAGGDMLLAEVGVRQLSGWGRRIGNMK